MRIMRGDPRVWDVQDAAVVIGMLDGVHRGHQALIEHLKTEGEGLVPTVLTFEPHPRAILSPGNPPRRLSSLSRKAELLKEQGIEVLAIADFTEEFSRLTPEEFCSGFLVTGLDARLVAVADQFRFGVDGSGTVADLKAWGATMGFDVSPIAPAMDGDQKISSTVIREAVAAGDMLTAARQLGRPFRLTGTVIEGRRMGRGMGFPTANLELDDDLAIPGNGVYRAHALLGQARYRAAVNVGVRPTTDDDGTVTVEAHILDFADDCYGRELSLDFVERIRNEQRFDSVEHLRAQIERDVEQVRQG